MGKKGKGANKLAKMSEEERARYLQHRADMEEEARRRKQQLIAIFMKNKLKREEAFSRLNLAKINQEWRSILRQMKCKELREELNGVEKDFNNALERKDQTIQRLIFDLDESEEMYGTMLHTHMENIEKLINLHRDRLNFWKQKYYDEKKSLLEQYQMEIDQYKEHKFKAHENLECVFYGLENITNNQIKIAENNHFKKMDNLKSGMILKYELLTQNREKQIEKLWKTLQIYLNNYLKYTEEFHSEYVDLKQKDDEDTKIIRQHYLEIVKSTEQITELKYELESTRDEQNLHVKQLLKYKQLLQKRHDNIKWEMFNGIAEDKNNLRQMIVLSNQTITKLKMLLKKGQTICQIGKICKKFEQTHQQQQQQQQQEFSLPNKQSKILFKNSIDELKEPPDEFKENTLIILSHMDNFWIRFNNARLDCVLLEDEKKHLWNENQELKLKLKEYLTNVTMTNGLTINNRGHLKEKQLIRPYSMKAEKIVHIDLIQLGGGSGNGKEKKRRPVTCIEGNLSVAVRSRYLISRQGDRVKAMPDIFSIVH